jgi:hypothetical protein
MGGDLGHSGATEQRQHAITGKNGENGLDRLSAALRPSESPAAPTHLGERPEELRPEERLNLHPILGSR